MNNTIVMTVRKDGWVSGTLMGISFTALVLSEGSAFGINNGRVSKLFMNQNGKRLLSYDRAWEMEAEEKPVLAAYMRILSGLESLPV